jgi:hypothetical protein
MLGRQDDDSTILQMPAFDGALHEAYLRVLQVSLSLWTAGYGRAHLF